MRRIMEVCTKMLRELPSDGSPLRGEKGFVYEGGHRVPLLVCWSLKIPGGRRIQNQIIGLHDLFRTLCGLAEVVVPVYQANDSYDFSKVLTARGEESPLVRRFNVHSIEQAVGAKYKEDF